MDHPGVGPKDALRIEPRGARANRSINAFTQLPLQLVRKAIARDQTSSPASGRGHWPHVIALKQMGREALTEFKSCSDD
jgi:hypothetical protein